MFRPKWVDLSKHSWFSLCHYPKFIVNKVFKLRMNVDAENIMVQKPKSSCYGFISSMNPQLSRKEIGLKIFLFVLTLIC